ncbi:DUF4935 domain-containing protein [Comamonas denitrificans]|uniref:DUF4935 domain-containing protein n=1 Tax=Comamonas denitrificans TaxID=117506 RepID=A0A939KE96_9BURK|nr:PIN domain-containing protein [Comamonas denitrificans]MBO1250471.1 DUF4935 domain-containing protein [Comamonas denitrificans]
MKNKFSWYSPLTQNEVDEAWDAGILTVDANVLLDLYRYHEGTRDSLISSIEKLKCAKWLSAQTAEEFFRNRKKSILSSRKTFKEAQDEIDKLKAKATEVTQALKSNRLVPSSITEKLSKDSDELLLEAAKAIEEEIKKHPDFLDDDPILEKLYGIFANSIGDDFSEADKKTHTKTAEERKNKKIPPGYMDKDKDGDRSYGDYFFWRQVLDHAKAQAKPVIIVTSEKKEDWWEIISGQTIGPRYELLKEAYEVTGKKALIYQTDRFLSYALERLGEKKNEKAVAEISEISELRYAGNAVRKTTQTCSISTSTNNVGELSVILGRPVRNFTGSGHFSPQMAKPPRLEVSLIKGPSGIPMYKLGGGTGTVFDFNLHIKATDNTELLPEGLYVFEYQAMVE